MNGWYDSNLSQIKLHEFKLKYPQLDVKTFEYIAQYGNLNDFRLLCNMLQRSGYEYTYFNQDYSTIKSLIEVCNRRVDEVLGEEYASLYEFLMRSQNHERWIGDEKYKLYAYDMAPDNDREVILSIVTIAANVGKSLTIQLFKDVGSLYRSGPGTDLYPELDMYNDMVLFNKRNADREIHVKRWLSFMDLVWCHDWNEAYNLICQYNAIKEEMLEKRRG